MIETRVEQRKIMKSILNSTGGRRKWLMELQKFSVLYPRSFKPVSRKIPIWLGIFMMNTLDGNISNSFPPLRTPSIRVSPMPAQLSITFMDRTSRNSVLLIAEPAVVTADLYQEEEAVQVISNEMWEENRAARAVFPHFPNLEHKRFSEYQYGSNPRRIIILSWNGNTAKQTLQNDSWTILINQ